MFNLTESFAWLSVRQTVASVTIRQPKKLKKVFNTVFTQFIQDIVKLHQGQTTSEKIQNYFCCMVHSKWPDRQRNFCEANNYLTVIAEL